MSCRPCPKLPRNGIIANEKMKPRRQFARCHGHHGINLQLGIEAMATTVSICNSGSTPWLPRHQSATRDRRHGHHGLNLQLGIDAMATTASICNSGSMPWPPRRQSATRDRCHGHHGVNLSGATSSGVTADANLRCTMGPRPMDAVRLPAWTVLAWTCLPISDTVGHCLPHPPRCSAAKPKSGTESMVDTYPHC